MVLIRLIDDAKDLFLHRIKNFGEDPFGLVAHIDELERWSEYMLKMNPEADRIVVTLAIYLHDIGHYPIPYNGDHAVRSEEIAKEYLADKMIDEEQKENILHCIRSHRCKDVMPDTKEAKIIAFIDSASHLSLSMYLKMAKEKGSCDMSLAKLERDYRDLVWFPEEQHRLTALYKAWKKLLEEYDPVLKHL